VHCDLKPENVMMDADGHIVLTGFGCAKVLGSSSNTHIQRTVIPCASKEYQAPEIHLGWVHDFSVDCWAFGILLYVMLFGRVGIDLLFIIICSRSVNSILLWMITNLRTGISFEITLFVDPHLTSLSSRSEQWLEI
jgi:serine/threonine protein kinase